MKHLPATIDSIPEAIAWLKSGGIIAHPTDTCYGFAALASSKLAVEATRALKGSRAQKPRSILVSDLSMVKRFAMIPKEAKVFVERWPAPLTLLLPKRDTLPVWINDRETVGVRIPDHAWTKNLIAALGEPIVTTSANLADEQEPYEIETVVKIFESRARELGIPLLLVDGGVLPFREPSTIVSFETGLPVVVRQGSLRIY